MAISLPHCSTQQPSFWGCTLAVPHSQLQLCSPLAGSLYGRLGHVAVKEISIYGVMGQTLPLPIITAYTRLLMPTTWEVMRSPVAQHLLTTSCSLWVGQKAASCVGMYPHFRGLARNHLPSSLSVLPSVGLSEISTSACLLGLPSLLCGTTKDSQTRATRLLLYYGAQIASQRSVVTLAASHPTSFSANLTTLTQRSSLLMSLRMNVTWPPLIKTLISSTCGACKMDRSYGLSESIGMP